MIKRISICFIALLLCFSFVACSKGNSIIGEWDFSQYGEGKTMTFMNDGIYTVAKEDGTIEEDGTYEVDGDKIIFTSAFRIEGDKRLNLQETGNDILIFNIKGKTLTLTTNDGDSFSLFFRHGIKSNG